MGHEVLAPPQLWNGPDDLVDLEANEHDRRYQDESQSPPQRRRQSEAGNAG